VLVAASDSRFNVIILEIIDNRHFSVGMKDSSGWMPGIKGKSVCITWLSSPVVPIPDSALWNSDIFMELGNCTPGDLIWLR
jgi:hypothetical protein